MMAAAEKEDNQSWFSRSHRVLGDTIHFALVAFSGLPNSSRNRRVPGQWFLDGGDQGQVAILPVGCRVGAGQGKVSPKGHPTSVST